MKLNKKIEKKITKILQNNEKLIQITTKIHIKLNKNNDKKTQIKKKKEWKILTFMVCLVSAENYKKKKRKNKINEKGLLKKLEK